MVPWRGTWCHGGVHGAMEEYMVSWRSTWCHGGVHGAMEGYMVPWRSTWCHGGVHGAMEEYMVPLTSNRSKVTVGSDSSYHDNHGNRSVFTSKRLLRVLWGSWVIHCLKVDNYVLNC